MEVNLEGVLYALDKHPEHASLVGQIAAAWSAVEYQLCQLFAAIINAPPWRAQAAFFALVNNSARIDMIRAIASEETIDEATRTAINGKGGIVAIARSAADQRNRYVHKAWTLENGDAYLLENIGHDWPHGQKRKIKTDELKMALTELEAAHNTIGAFVMAYSDTHPIQVGGRQMLPKSLQKTLDKLPHDPGQ